ncbi:MAG: hypothetical protein QF402_23385, partial [Candidatus Latescibacteria bacterium]|nr:hypothetical protein [Candidatus Latescibacterota bacterium]
ILSALPSVVIGSFSLGVVIYSLLTREYALLVNLISYALSMIRALAPQTVGFVFLLVAVIIALASGYVLLSREYQRYTSEVSGLKQEGIPLWITIMTGLAVILICLYGLSLLKS